jgi:hypothetical protein
MKETETFEHKDSHLEKPKTIFQRSIESGLSGAAAMSMNIATLMWLRTTINYQYRYGVNMQTAFQTLYRQGGIMRFYSGAAPAFIQGPFSRFGDTFANTWTISMLNTNVHTQSLPIFAKSICASVGAGLFRIFLMPIDTVKTTMQVEGKKGISNLKKKFRTKGPGIFYHGSLASASSTIVGHYPWFTTFNILQEKIPKSDTSIGKLARNAAIGFSATCVSDTLSNSIRVVKVYKQSSAVSIGYTDVVKKIVNEDGIMSLFGRGLKTKLLANGLQGIMFSVLWKYIDESFFKNIEATKT